MDQEQLSESSHLLRAKEQKVSWSKLPTWPETVTSIVVGTWYLGFGFSYSFSSPTILPLQEQGLLSPDQASWYGSVVTVGQWPGTLLAGYMADTLGRKPTLMICTLPAVAGWICIICANNLVWLLVGRILTGLANGITAVTPIYVAETASRNYRGAFGAITYTMLPLATVLLYTLALWIDWQWLAVVSMAPSVILVITLIPVPETPRWLMRNGQHREALEVLSWFRKSSLSDKELCQEYFELQKEANRQNEAKVTLSEVFKIRRVLAISFFMGFFQQVSGVMAVLFFTEPIFEMSGYRGDPGIPSLMFAVVKAGSNIISFFLADRAGRKVTLVTGAVGMAISHVALGTYFFLLDSQPNAYVNLSWLPLVAILSFALSYSFGWGYLPLLIPAELSPLKSRGLVTSFGAFTASIVGFLVTTLFLPMEEKLGTFGVFWFFAGTCTLAAMFCGFGLPETRGKDLELLH